MGFRVSKETDLEDLRDLACTSQEKLDPQLEAKSLLYQASNSP